MKHRFTKRLLVSLGLLGMLAMAVPWVVLAHVPTDVNVTIKGSEPTDTYTNSLAVQVNIGASHCPPGGDMNAIEVSLSNTSAAGPWQVVKAAGAAWPAAGCSTPAPADFSWDLAAGADGARTAHARLRHGTDSVVVSDSIIVDTTPPVTSLGSVAGGALGSNGWYVASPSISLASTDSGSGADQTYYQFVAYGSAAPVNDLPGSWISYAAAFSAPEGDSELYAFSTDVATNKETPTNLGRFKVDLTNPMVAITSPENGSSTSDASITVSGTSSDAVSGVASVLVNGVVATLGSGTFSASPVPLDCGLNTITAMATDNAGRTGQAEASVTRSCSSYTTNVLKPLDPSTAGNTVTNRIRNGRIAPIKLEIYLGGVEQTLANVPATPTVKVAPVACYGSGPGTLVEEYGAAGSSNTDNELRWSNDGFWIYNLDTRALGLEVGKCYRVDVYVGHYMVTNSDSQWVMLEVAR